MTKTAQQKYDSANTVFIGLKLNKKTDADIIEYLQKQPNKQGKIKQIVRIYQAIEKLF